MLPLRAPKAPKTVRNQQSLAYGLLDLPSAETTGNRHKTTRRLRSGASGMRGMRHELRSCVPWTRTAACCRGASPMSAGSAGPQRSPRWKGASQTVPCDLRKPARLQAPLRPGGAGGFTANTERHRPLATVACQRCPFADLPHVVPYAKKHPWDDRITADEMRRLPWVPPTEVVEVSYLGWTRHDLLRQRGPEQSMVRTLNRHCHAMLGQDAEPSP
jgi:hypothetical protein